MKPVEEWVRIWVDMDNLNLGAVKKVFRDIQEEAYRHGVYMAKREFDRLLDRYEAGRRARPDGKGCSVCSVVRFYKKESK